MSVTTEEKDNASVWNKYEGKTNPKKYVYNGGTGEMMNDLPRKHLSPFSNINNGHCIYLSKHIMFKENEVEAYNSIAHYKKCCTIIMNITGLHAMPGRNVGSSHI